MRKTILLLVTLSVLLSACNTVRGFGRDVETVGDAIQRKSSR
ncbi:MAG TPA: entericidin A/B family lipoprotein [Burkholderiales bacterium]|jgi:predicted small secreted protein|nr:entericidin A/B family lipoprotein [Burkholderiales bacterium]